MWSLQKNVQGVGQTDYMRWLRKRFHANCSNLGVDELIIIENGSSDWYCTNCKADCDLCSRAGLNGHKAVQCDSCEL